MTMYAEILLPIPVDQPYTYRVPEHFREQVQVGCQVIVPLGPRYMGGLVAGFVDQPPDGVGEVKSVYDVVDARPFARPELINLLKWIADYYVCHLGEALRLIQPEVNLLKSQLEVRLAKEHVATAQLSPRQEQIVSMLSDDKWISVLKLSRKVDKKGLIYALNRLKEQGIIEKRYTPPRQRKVFRSVTILSVLPAQTWSETALEKYRENGSKRYVRARELIRLLQEKPLEKTLVRQHRFSDELINRLVKEGVLQRTKQQVPRELTVVYEEELIKNLELTDEQAEFVQNAAPFVGEQHRHRVFLLHGITGSGKTQIYIELIHKAVKAGQGTIVLIPEIVLTPQTLARFRNVFGDKVGVIHSRLSRGERLEMLHRIREGHYQVVIGPRSAIFAPFANLGLIIIDEEHEGSYKQQDSAPRYHARDVGIYRAFLNNIPVVLGSATPSMESFYNAQHGKYHYFYLSQRIHARNLPRTFLVNVLDEWRKAGARQVICESLLLKLETRLLSKEQAMLFLNRRGFSPYIQCHECGYVAKCENCDITLTYHYAGKKIRCHYCGFETDAPDFCPECKGFDVLYKGIGTQKIEQEAKERFPHARLLRMDQDTTKGRQGHARLLEKFRNYEADFLIGTKMIAKGLDFSRVTLVGVINADQGLHFPDFRASEKVFQMLVQASGRAGRGASSGEVVIQTFDPNHFIFQYLLQHDFKGFYQKELTTRESLKYPPFSRLALLRFSGENESSVLGYAQSVAKFLWSANTRKRFVILGPAPAPVARINNRYRYQILIKQERSVDPALGLVRRVLRKGLLENPEVRKWPVKVEIDIDPTEIL